MALNRPAVAYVVTSDFSTYQASNPSAPLPAGSLDIELSNIATTISELRERIAMIQRDDGALANLTVGDDQLAASLEATLQAYADAAAADAAAAATSASQANTSNSSATTQAAGAATSSAAATTAKNAAEAAQTAAELAETNAATSASNASTSATNAATSASNASTSEANAAASETSAETYRDQALTSSDTANSAKDLAQSSAADALASATAASTSESNAAASATAAAASASSASTSETNAATSATGAQTAQALAEAARDAAIDASNVASAAYILPAHTSASATVTIDADDGDHFVLNGPTASVSLWAFANFPASARIVIETVQGGSPVLIALPNNIKWSGGMTPPVTQVANAIDAFELITRDSGTTWLGRTIGQNFS